MRRQTTIAAALAIGALGGCGGGGGGGEQRIDRYIRSDGGDTRLVVEVDAVEGYAPPEGVRSRLVDGLSRILDKPDGIEVVVDDTLDARGEDHRWTKSERRSLADEAFDLDVDDGTVKMHALFVDGRDEDDGVLGVAWDHTHMIIYAQRIDEACSGGVLGPVRRELLCRNAELSIWTHEVGHTLGLVNNGLAMVEDHEDPEHPAHDRNDRCVMYWAYEGERLVERLRTRMMSGNDDALRLDSACRADVTALRDG